MTTTLRRPPPAPVVRTASPSPRRTSRAALLLTATTLVVAGAAVAGAVAVDRLSDGPPAPQTVSVGESVALPGVELTVSQFARRRDATTGTGTAQQPMSGPAMPMAAGTPGGAHAMASMPGMAGALEQGQERLDVSLVVRGSGDRAVSLDPDRFRVYSAGRPVELLRPTVTTLTRTPLARGTAMRGGLVLVVPTGTSPLELAYGDEPARVVLEDGTTPSGPSAPQPGHGATHAQVAR